MDSEQPPSLFRPTDGFYRWDGVPYQPYKQDGSAPFKDISRQTLFHDASLGCELRYFEMGAAGYSTLERHEHTHAVMIFRGQGQCLLGTQVLDVKEHDLITISAWTWHQFRASGDAPMGFLCMVNTTRDRPALPTEAELQAMRATPAVARFLGGT